MVRVRFIDRETGRSYGVSDFSPHTTLYIVQALAELHGMDIEILAVSY